MQEVLAGRRENAPSLGRERAAAPRRGQKNPAEGKRPRRRLQRGKRNRKRGNRISNLENILSIPGKFEINLDIL